MYMYTHIHVQYLDVYVYLTCLCIYVYIHFMYVHVYIYIYIVYLYIHTWYVLYAPLRVLESTPCWGVGILAALRQAVWYACRAERALFEQGGPVLPDVGESGAPNVDPQ